MTNNIATPIEELIEKAGTYGKTTIELIKLKALDKTANVISSLTAKTILFIIVAMVILITSIGVALWIGELLGKAYYGFFALAAFYDVIVILLYFFSNKWIKKPISESIIKHILQ
jgi:hypothetical protein